MRTCVIAMILLVVLCLGAASAKKKKVKTTFKALKCSACKAVAEEIKQEVVAAVSLRRMSSPALILAFTSDCDILCR